MMPCIIAKKSFKIASWCHYLVAAASLYWLFFLPGGVCFGVAFHDNTMSLFGSSQPLGDKAAWGDYNNDGWVDISAGGIVYRNNGGTSFSQTSYSSGWDGLWGDFNNDGRLDLFGYGSKTLLQNNGSGGFVNASSRIPSFGTHVSRGAAWTDINNDGYLDLYVGGYEDFDLNITYPDKFLTYNKSTQQFGVFGQETVYRARGVTAADFNRDGHQDVYVSNYRLQPNRLWLGPGFPDVAPSYGAAGAAHTIGSAWGDLNNDGYLDLFVGNFSHAGQEPAHFLKNLGPTGSYHFQDMKDLSGADWQESYASPALVDYDNDGNLDLFFTTVYPSDHCRLYRNTGNWQFTDVTNSVGLGSLGQTYQAAWADVNNDGFPDLATNGKLFINTPNANHWLKMKILLDGSSTTINRGAIGAQVRINVSGQTITRQVEGGTGEGNQNDLTLLFGLGSYSGPVSGDILWPDGTVQTFAGLGTDRMWTITSTTAAPLWHDAWQLSNSGDWNTASNWSGLLVPNAAGAAAELLGSITSPQTVFTNTAVTIGAMTFDNASTYVIAGAGSLTVAVSSGSGSINVLQGSHKINLPLIFASNTIVTVASGATLTLGNPTTINAGKTVTKNGNLVIQAPLKILAGGALVNGTGAMSVLGAPSLGTGAKIDLKNTSMSIDYAGQASPVGTILGQLTSGYASGAWSGEGIMTSSALACQTGLGWKDDVASQSILVKYTYYGDANLDGKVDISDLGSLAAAWQTSAIWSQGDFDYSGLVDISDLGKLATNWQLGVGAPLGPNFDQALATLGLSDIAVPEPSLEALLIGSLGLPFCRRPRD